MDPVPQFSPESARALQAATARLIEVMREYDAHATSMSGRTSEMDSLFEREELVAAAIAEWNERASDHTGSYPIDFHFEDEGTQDGDYEEESREDELTPEGQFSVVDRWDIDVSAIEELIEAGRDAHRRMWPADTEEDAALVINDPWDALSAITEEEGPPQWFDVPGLDVRGGVRVYVVPEGEFPIPEDEPEDPAGAVTPPGGRVVFAQTWKEARPAGRQLSPVVDEDSGTK